MTVRKYHVDYKSRSGEWTRGTDEPVSFSKAMKFVEEYKKLYQEVRYYPVHKDV